MSKFDKFMKRKTVQDLVATSKKDYRLMMSLKEKVASNRDKLMKKLKGIHMNIGANKSDINMAQKLGSIHPNTWKDQVKKLPFPKISKGYEKFTKGKILGEGHYGVVRDFGNDKVVKIVRMTKQQINADTYSAKIDSNYDDGWSLRFLPVVDGLIQEVSNQKKAAAIGIAAAIHQTYYRLTPSELVVYIVMDKLPGVTLNQYFGQLTGALFDIRYNQNAYAKKEQETNDIRKEIDHKIDDLLAKLHKIHIVHQDAHYDNIYIHESQLKLLDFGLSYDLTDPRVTMHIENDRRDFRDDADDFALRFNNANYILSII